MRAATILLLASLAGCGYFGSGTWDDDPANWGRAFDASLPAGAVVKHSRYTRFPHLTREFECFFALAPNAELTRSLAADPALVRLRAEDSGWARTGGTPEWFAPKAARAYDVYAFAAAPRRDFRVFVDRITREVFLAERRL
jgi:hypothetical protein